MLAQGSLGAERLALRHEEVPVEAEAARGHVLLARAELPDEVVLLGLAELQVDPSMPP